MRVLILTISFILIYIPASAQSRHFKNNYLLEHAIAIKNDETDFSFLKKVIGEKQFVFLSDGHQSGSSKIYFTQLIQYLHEELDFDVLLLESGIYGAELANSKMNAAPAASNLISQKYIAHFISACDASEHLFHYIGETKAGIDPMQLSGLDISFNQNQNLLFQMLDSAFRKQNDKLLSDKNYSLFKNYFDSLETTSSRNQLDSLQKNFLFHYADTLADFINTLKDSNGFLHLTGENIRAYVKGGLYKTPVYNSNSRNAQMYLNLNWLMEMKYPGLKIIIWASPAHLAENFMDGETSLATDFYKKYKRTDVFYIAASNFSTDGKSTAPKESLSADMHHAHLKTAMLLFHQPGEEKAFINQTNDSRFFDAVLFFDDMKNCSWVY